MITRKICASLILKYVLTIVFSIFFTPASVDENLAHGNPTSASSDFANMNPSSNVVDNNLSQAAQLNVCWVPAQGSTDQWIMIDLANYYFVREVIVYNKQTGACVGCGE